MISITLSVVALLDLPLGTILTVDGKSIVLQKDDFVGFDQIPVGGDLPFHLITIRATAPSRDNRSNSQREYASPITTGFIVMEKEINDSTITIVRRFDPNTSEVSSDPVDDQTRSSLLQHIHHGGVDTQRLISYRRVLSTVDEEAWKSRTKFVSSELIGKRGLCHGEKIIPGTYQSDDVLLPPTDTSLASVRRTIVDGKAIAYPPIPVLDKNRGTRHVSHAGTRAYLAQLTPSDRTQLFTDTTPTSRLMDAVIERYYDMDWQELLGDLQLSYLLFLFLHCLSSFEHWRDLVALLSTADSEQVIRHNSLYENVLVILGSQIQSMESDFFEDVQISGDNFLVPSIRRLCHTCSSTNDLAILTKLQVFTQILSRRIPQALEDKSKDGQAVEESNHLICEPQRDFSGFLEDEVMTDQDLASDEDDDDEDGPVIVPEEEVEAFAARSEELKPYSSNLPQLEYAQILRESYPMLFAAKMPQEDVLMTCARALDEANDVSLVREAAAYLENIEASRGELK